MDNKFFSNNYRLLWTSWPIFPLSSLYRRQCVKNSKLTFFVQGNGLRIFLFIELLLWAFACLYGYYNENIFILVVAILSIIFLYIPTIFNSNYINTIIRELNQMYKDPSLTKKETDVSLPLLVFALYLFIFYCCIFQKP